MSSALFPDKFQRKVNIYCDNNIFIFPFSLWGKHIRIDSDIFIDFLPSDVKPTNYILVESESPWRVATVLYGIKPQLNANSVTVDYYYTV